MKDNTFGTLVLGGSFVVAIIIMLASCVFIAGVEKPAPCCGEEECATYESEVIESIEEPDLTRDYEEGPEALGPYTIGAPEQTKGP